MITLLVSNDAPANVVEAVRQANLLLQGEELYARIAARPEPFDLSQPATLTPATVAARLRALTETLTVVLHRFAKPKTTGGYTCSTRRRHILRVSNRPNHVDNAVPVIVNTLIHECVHALDCFAGEFQIGHGDNSRNGKANTAAYWIGDVAGQLAAGAPLAFNNDVETDALA